ncbi:hypothetical protein [Chryseobacterium binzhouense]|uniref:hypothetical protein n=1 Tax=Chryseobacterium binzhouense TaxID=2593646 RepID=UPI00289781A2|nr:hypothetical protein [Chryseobacterium binzhouense]
MKKITLIFSIILSQLCFSQIGLTAASPNAFFESLYFKDFRYEYKDVKGSPYLNNDFQFAQIGDYKNIPMRYNSYTDEFEFKKDDLNYILPKEDNLSPIIFQNRDKQFVLQNINGNMQYLEEINSEAKLFKKYTTIFKELKRASTTYEQDSPPSFEQIPPKYYIIKKDGTAVEFSKKKIENSFPEKYKALKVYIKKNNLNYEREADLIRMAIFLK